ncbi:MAG: GNAT family N-acetyltransferase [Candidatus Daviesbacteria bacterium]|nr:GNAT family N-acetyltransferase [Candidatus Daviesbacteria bacterium]
MKIEIRQASLKQKEVLEKLLEEYLTELRKTDPRITEYKYLDLYWKEPERIPLFVFVNNEQAGFVFVNERTTLPENKGAKAIAEFFIKPEFRNKGIGEEVAFLVFNKFPGKWEVEVMEKNIIGLKFWEKVISDYTKGDFKKVILDNESWKGPVYSFKNE